jgi:hypothetical protein
VTKDGIGLPGTHSCGTSKLPPVTHDGLVWHQQGPYASAKIHGTISGAEAGEVAHLSTPGSTTAAPRVT